MINGILYIIEYLASLSISIVVLSFSLSMIISCIKGIVFSLILNNQNYLKDLKGAILQSLFAIALWIFIGGFYFFLLMHFMNDAVAIGFLSACIGVGPAIFQLIFSGFDPLFVKDYKNSFFRFFTEEAQIEILK